MNSRPPAQGWPVPPADLVQLSDRLRSLPPSALVCLLARVSRDCDLQPHVNYVMDKRNADEMHTHGVGVLALAARSRDQHDRIMRSRYRDSRNVPEYPRNVLQLLPGSKREIGEDRTEFVSMPETGHLTIESTGRGWIVHHTDWDYDHAAIVADSLPTKRHALCSMFLYAAECISAEINRRPDDGGKGAA